MTIKHKAKQKQPLHREPCLRVSIKVFVHRLCCTVELRIILKIRSLANACMLQRGKSDHHHIYLMPNATSHSMIRRSTTHIKKGKISQDTPSRYWPSSTFTFHMKIFALYPGRNMKKTNKQVTIYQYMTETCRKNTNITYVKFALSIVI